MQACIFSFFISRSITFSPQNEDLVEPRPPGKTYSECSCSAISNRTGENVGATRLAGIPLYTLSGIETGSSFCFSSLSLALSYFILCFSISSSRIMSRSSFTAATSPCLALAIRAAFTRSILFMKSGSRLLRSMPCSTRNS